MPLGRIVDYHLKEAIKMLIKEAIEKTGVSKKFIRYYEQQGLIHPEKLSNGYRDYHEVDLEKIRAIKKLRNFEFSRTEIERFFENKCEQDAIISEKLSAIDRQLVNDHHKKEQLLLLKTGVQLDEIDDDFIAVKADQPYMFLQNIYCIFGWLNMVSFVLIVGALILFRNLGITNIHRYILAQSLLIMFSLILYERRRKVRTTHLERKPLEVISQYVVNLSSYVLTGLILNDSIFYMRYFFQAGNYIRLGMNAMLGLSFLVASLIIVVFSFINSDTEVFKESIEVIK